MTTSGWPERGRGAWRLGSQVILVLSWLTTKQEYSFTTFLFFFSQIHYDGWPEEYDVWAEDSSPLIHPQGWCARTGHPLAPPLSEYCRRIQKNTARTVMSP